MEAKERNWLLTPLEILSLPIVAAQNTSLPLRLLQSVDLLSIWYQI
jgi:hypothetical protein